MLHPTLDSCPDPGPGDAMPGVACQEKEELQRQFADLIADDETANSDVAKLKAQLAAMQRQLEQKAKRSLANDHMPQGGP